MVHSDAENIQRPYMVTVQRRVLAVIPARGGSKGLPGKNIYPLAGKPLIVYSIEAAQEAHCVTTVVVSSDDSKILRVSADAGAETVIRPPELATDTATSEAAVLHTLTTMTERSGPYDVLLLLQPTSPLRTAHDIDDAYTKFSSGKGTALLSVAEPEHSPYKAFTIATDGFLHGLVSDEAPFRRRQDFPPAYQPNGAIYLIFTQDFVKRKSFYTEKTLPYIMPRERSVDIDTLDDLKKIESLLVHRR